MHTPRAAVIDLGSNTFKYIVGSLDADGLNILLDDSLTVRLAADLQKEGNIGHQSMQRGLDAMEQILTQLKRYKPFSLIVTGAQTLRQAHDASVFLDLVKRSLNLDIRILSGKEEAQLAWSAATMDTTQMDGIAAVLDLGGGSLELSFGKAGDLSPQQSVSLPLGAVLLTQKFISNDPPLDSELQALADYIALSLKPVLHGFPISTLLGIGGAVINLAAINLHQNGSDTILSADNLDELIKLLASLPLIERKKIPGLDPQRADIIIAGAVVIREVLRYLGTTELFVCRRGIRHALLAAALAH